MNATETCVTQKKNWLWLLIRIVILFFGFFATNYSLKLFGVQFPKFPWSFSVMAFVFMSIGIPFLVYMQPVNSDEANRWIKPSWFKNPFDNKQPVQFFHFASFYFIALGLGSLFLELIHKPIVLPWNLPMAMGCGAFIGVQICLFLFSKQFK